MAIVSLLVLVSIDEKIKNENHFDGTKFQLRKFFQEQNIIVKSH